MPVLECSCGMVMSVSIAKPRTMCIRCGGVEFRELERFKLDVKATNCAPQAPTIICANYTGSLSELGGHSTRFDNRHLFALGAH
jgi:hypothetical protein